MFKYAITRQPGENFAQGITSSSLGKPDFNLMVIQHQAYVTVLRTLGLQVIVLEALPAFPDAYFVEDVAMMTPEVAVITNPGAPPRNGEEKAIEPVIAGYRRIQKIHPPGTLDGGDVLMVGNRFFIGVSERTNQAGAEQLGSILEKHGYTWTTVPVEGGLHLKSSVNHVGSKTLLVLQEYAGDNAFKDFDQILVDETEAYACNTLFVNDCLLTPKGFPNTLAKLHKLGMPVIELDVSEAQKMDGGLTCMSLRF